MKISDKKKLLTNKNSYMSIISYSCIDNSYGLFDYHSSTNSENKIYGLGSFHVNFEGDNAVYKRNLSGEDIQLLHVAQANQKYYISSKNVELHHELIEQPSSSKQILQPEFNNIHHAGINSVRGVDRFNVLSHSSLFKNDMWGVVRNWDLNKYGFRGKKLEKDDVLKIGRYILKIVDISTHENKDEPANIKCF